MTAIPRRRRLALALAAACCLAGGGDEAAVESRLNYAALLAGRGRVREAEAEVRVAIGECERLPASAPLLGRGLVMLARFAIAARRQPEAEALLRRAVTVLEKDLGSDDSRTREAVQLLAEVTRSSRRPAPVRRRRAPRPARE